LKGNLRQKAEGTKAPSTGSGGGMMAGLEPAPTSRNDSSAALYKRLEREVHGLLADLGLMQQRTDEFVDQEDIVKRFIQTWVKVVDKIEVKVIKQIEAWKTKVKV